MRDPYSVLGVPPGCSDRTLKKAMRELSKRWHPDMNPGREQMVEIRFNEIQEAYEQILEERRSGRSETYADPSSAKKRAWSKGASHVDPNDDSAFHWEKNSTWENTGFTYQRTEPKPEEEDPETKEIYGKADELISKGLDEEIYWLLKKIPKAKQDTPLWNYYMAMVYKTDDPFYAYEHIIRSVREKPEDERSQKLFGELATEENRKAMKRKIIKEVLSNEFEDKNVWSAFAIIGFDLVLVALVLPIAVGSKGQADITVAIGMSIRYIVIGVVIMIICTALLFRKLSRIFSENSDIL